MDTYLEVTFLSRAEEGHQDSFWRFPFISLISCSLIFLYIQKKFLFYCYSKFSCWFFFCFSFPIRFSSSSFISYTFVIKHKEQKKRNKNLKSCPKLMLRSSFSSSHLLFFSYSHRVVGCPLTAYDLNKLSTPPIAIVADSFLSLSLFRLGSGGVNQESAQARGTRIGEERRERE